MFDLEMELIVLINERVFKKSASANTQLHCLNNRFSSWQPSSTQGFVKLND
jgi:hypothetical protein